MGCFGNALDCAMGMMPFDWLDPYGDMPLANGMEASVDINIEQRDGGMHITSVKTPPRDGRIRLSDMLQSLLGPEMGLECADDQAKCKPEKECTEPCEPDKMDSSKPTGLKGQGSQPWAGGKSSEAPGEERVVSKPKTEKGAKNATDGETR